MILHHGRPADCAGRLEKEIRVYDFLEKLCIPFDRADHEPAMTMEACEAISQVLDAPICKNLLLCNRQCTDFYLLLTPGDKPFKTSVLSRQIGSSRLSFASAEFMEQLLDITPGSLSVLGLMNDREHRVRLLIDRDVLTSPRFGCHPCINTSSLGFSTDALLQKILPQLGYEPEIVTLPREI